MAIHILYSELQNINARITDIDKTLKQLKHDKKVRMNQLYEIMKEQSVENYKDISIKTLEPKEKRKPLTEKKKREALILHFKKLGITDPEKFVKEMRDIERNSR